MNAAPDERKLPAYILAARISIAYALIAGIWIYASDSLIAGLASYVGDIVWLQMYKGWLFVTVTALLLYGIIVVAFRSGARQLSTAVDGITLPEDADQTSAKRRWNQAVVPLLIFAALTLAIGLTGWLTYENQRTSLQRDKNADIGAVANIKVAEIVRWLEDRRAHATLIASDPFLAAALGRWLADGAAEDAQRDKLVAWLDNLQRALGYSSLAIVDAGGQVLLSTAPMAMDQASLERSAMARTDGDAKVSDLFRVDGAAGKSFVALDVVAPLRPKGASPGLESAVLVLRIDAEHYLFPLVQSWPKPSPTADTTAETLLVRREGDEILFLNALRHAPDPPMTLRRSVSDPDLPPAKAFRGEPQGLESRDYRGVPVLAVTRPVQGTDWLMVSKIDADEVYGPLRHIALVTAAVVAICIAVAGSGVALWWEQQRARLLAANLRARLERQALVHHFDYLSKYANDIILLSDERGRLVEVNARAEQAYGYHHDELIGQSDEMLYDPSARGIASQRARQRPPAGGLVFETQHRRKDGSIFPVEISSRNIDVRGRRFHHSIVRDISDRVQAEMRARELDEQLRRVGIANELGQMVSSLAHELRQPLTAAMNYVNACRRLLEGAAVSSAKALTMTVKAGEQIGRADLLVSDLRTFVQKRDTIYTSQCIAEIVDETMEFALIGATHLGIILRCQHDERSLAVRADKIRIQQVLINLMRNAVEAMSASARRELVIETRLSSPGEVEVLVADTGIGIAPEMTERVFEPFVTTKEGGMGIGLAVCRGIIESHGGRLWAEPAAGGGTIFRFTLPVSGGTEKAA